MTTDEATFRNQPPANALKQISSKRIFAKPDKLHWSDHSFLPNIDTKELSALKALMQIFRTVCVGVAPRHQYIGTCPILLSWSRWPQQTTNHHHNTKNRNPRKCECHASIGICCASVTRIWRTRCTRVCRHHCVRHHCTIWHPLISCIQANSLRWSARKCDTRRTWIRSHVRIIHHHATRHPMLNVIDTLQNTCCG